MPRQRKTPSYYPRQCGRSGAPSLVKDIFGEELEETCERCGYVPIAGEDDGSFWIGGVRYPPHSLVEEGGSFWLHGQLHPVSETPYPRWSQPHD